MSWGRIFFLYDEYGNLNAIKGQPLSNHVGNTGIILNQFHPSHFDDSTRFRLLKAAELHDEGKKETFRILDTREQDKIRGRSSGNEHFSYSFAGHRFRVPGVDAYIDGLIRSHHEFSVEQINREISGLHAEEKRRFADDLYLLCMADQLEAELAVKTVEKKKGDIPRSFMEFATRRTPDLPDTFNVIPWPFFRDEFALNLVLKIPYLENITRASDRQLQNAFEKNERFEEENMTITLRRGRE